eukprot:TRINITY_DN22446_c0_g1_i2.p1 TRINITY_DN22446_c0_g1~~TRINITY_DN22446_c0_g1_i2.p1  ORF type:complete len:287 (+),score=57.45 TRINITY_DN22446_c0_g1_i2:171-1031(+)
MLRSLVGSEMCIRDRYQRRVRGILRWHEQAAMLIRLDHQDTTQQLDLDSGQLVEHLALDILVQNRSLRSRLDGCPHRLCLEHNGETLRFGERLKDYDLEDSSIITVSVVPEPSAVQDQPSACPSLEEPLIQAAADGDLAAVERLVLDGNFVCVAAGCPHKVDGNQGDGHQFTFHRTVSSWAGGVPNLTRTRMFIVALAAKAAMDAGHCEVVELLLERFWVVGGMEIAECPVVWNPSCVHCPLPLLRHHKMFEKCKAGMLPPPVNQLPSAIGKAQGCCARESCCVIS